MRQGQQSRRSRGRGSNNNNNNQGSRKSQNPLTRSFESNGPDMKIRGTPSHIAEKYMALARDAQSSGDHVLAENYLQHAEHYNRIILAYREQQLSQGGGDPNLARPRPFNEGIDGGDDFGDEGTGDFVDPAQQTQPRLYDNGQPGMQPQPRAYDQPRFDDRQGGGRSQNDQYRHRNDRNDRGDRQDRGDRDRDNRSDRYEGRSERSDRGPDRSQDRGERGSDRGGSDRGDRYERQGGDRGGQPERAPPERASAERAPQPAAAEPGPAEQPSAGREPIRRRERLPQHHEQPEFLRRSVRRPRRESSSEAADEAAAPVVAADEPRQD